MKTDFRRGQFHASSPEGPRADTSPAVRNGRISAPELAETRKRTRVGDCVVVDAVDLEPVSTSDISVSREKDRENPIYGRRMTEPSSRSPAFTGSFARIPYGK